MTIERERKYGWRKDTTGKPFRAYRPTPRSGQVFPSSFDLGLGNVALSEILDQQNLGACTAFAACRVFRYGLAVLGQDIGELSQLFQYQNELTLDGDFGQDNGSTITQAIDAGQQFGICAASDWPYVPAKLSVKAPDQAYQDAKKFTVLQKEMLSEGAALIQHIKDALYNQKLPVDFGTTLFQQFESDQAAQTGVITLPARGASEIGGHSMIIRGWDDISPAGPACLVMNQWGPWGVNGACWIPYAYLQKYASDFWAVPQMA